MLKQAGHVVLGYAPPTDRSSAASLRSYAERRNVDLYVTGTSEQTDEGWNLSLRLRSPDGKAVGQALKFRADSLLGLIRELKAEGPSKLDRAVRGGSPASGVAALPAGRALPLPTRRARPPRPKSERPVLPGETPAAEPAEERTASRARPAKLLAAIAAKEVDLDEPAARHTPGGPESWDADSDAGEAKPARKGRALRTPEPSTPEPSTPEPKTASTSERGAKKLAALQRLATGRTASPTRASATGSGGAGNSIDLDADTRSALEESPRSKRAPAAVDERAEEPTGDPLAEPAAQPERTASAGSEVAMDADEPADGEESAPAEAKPKKKKGSLFAGRLSRNGKVKPSTEGGEGAGSGSDETSVEDRDPNSGASSGGGDAPLALLAARAGYLHRSLEYSSDLYKRLRAPTTNGWVYRFDASFFPFARPLKDRISLLASYEGAIAGTVHDGRADRDFGVTFSQWSGGMRYRQPLGAHEVGFQATISSLAAGLDDSSVVTGVPEIRYVLLSPAADVALHFGDVSVRGGLGYLRSVGGYGEIASADWFPHMGGYGVEAQLGLDYRLSPAVTFKTSGALRRFVLDMNSRPEDAVGGRAEVAGGAVDEYVSGYFGLQFTL